MIRTAPSSTLVVFGFQGHDRVGMQVGVDADVDVDVGDASVPRRLFCWSHQQQKNNSKMYRNGGQGKGKTKKAIGKKLEQLKKLDCDRSLPGCQ